MLLRTGKRLKRASSVGYDNEDDGLPLNDEMLLVIFARFLNTDVDLVRCAATCRRWRRLVSSEAAFICASDDTARFVPAGFFYQDEAYGVRGVPRFASLASHYFPRASANALFAVEPFASSRLVTSRKGRLVLELPGSASLRLAVCNPMTGDVTVLPELSGRDKPGRYACALLTADDGHHETLSSPSSFSLVIVYDRRDFTACRGYSSESDTWDQEAKVSGARVSGRTLAQAHPAAAVASGAVFWRVKDAVLALRLDDTLEATLEPLPEDSRGCGLLAVWPDGRLCVVEAGIRDVVTVRVVFREESGSDVWGENKKWDEWASWCLALTLQRPSGCYGDLTRVCPRGVCEKSRVVFLAAGFEGQNWEALYALDLEKKARFLYGVPDVGSSASFHGYEMDRVSYITALGNRGGKTNINITMDVGDIYDLY